MSKLSTSYIRALLHRLEAKRFLEKAGLSIDKMRRKGDCLWAKERNLYNSFQQATVKRNRVIARLEKAGLSYAEALDDPEFKKVSQECTQTLQKWSECLCKIKDRENALPSRKE